MHHGKELSGTVQVGKEWYTCQKKSDPNRRDGLSSRRRQTATVFDVVVAAVVVILANDNG